MALEKAKEAGRMERKAVKKREQLNLTDNVNMDLTFNVRASSSLVPPQAVRAGVVQSCTPIQHERDVQRSVEHVSSVGEE